MKNQNIRRFFRCWARRLATVLTLSTLAAAALAADPFSAHIPFPFRVSQQLMPPGNYCFLRTDTPGTYLVRNVRTGQAVFALATRTNVYREDRPAAISFTCAGQDCQLFEIQATNEPSRTIGQTRLK